MDIKKTSAISAIWSFAESTFFFIVPDVWLTIVAKDKLKMALIGVLFALVFSMIGGTILYFWSYYDIESVRPIVEMVPYVNIVEFPRAVTNLKEEGLLPMMISPWLGTQYKVYAIAAPHAGIPYWLFMLYSIPARATRFIILTLFAHYFFKVLDKLNIQINKLWFILICWTLFYAYFWRSF